MFTVVFYTGKSSTVEGIQRRKSMFWVYGLRMIVVTYKVIDGII